MNATSAAALSAVEARFIEAAVASILPEPVHPEPSIDAVGYLNRQFASKARRVDVRGLYRRGIAAIHDHCRLAYGRSFHELSLYQKHVVLSQFEDGCTEATFEDHTRFVDLLVRHAAEASLDAIQISPRR
jgi:Gluconate 2-dehydrogenase subunit 3